MHLSSKLLIIGLCLNVTSFTSSLKTKQTFQSWSIGMKMKVDAQNTSKTQYDILARAIGPSLDTLVSQQNY